MLARALSKRPEERFDTCTDFVAAARAALSAPVTAANDHTIDELIDQWWPRTQFGK